MIRQMITNSAAAHDDGRRDLCHALRAEAPDFDTHALLAHLGEGMDGISALMERVDDLDAQLGQATVERALLRVAYASGMRLDANGQPDMSGGMQLRPNSVQRAHFLGLPPPQLTFLSHDEALALSPNMHLAMRLAGALKAPEIFSDFTRRVIEHLTQEGMAYLEDGTFASTESPPPRNDQIERLTQSGLDPATSFATSRALGAVLDDTVRHRMAIDTLYDAGLGITTDHEIFDRPQG